MIAIDNAMAVSVRQAYVSFGGRPVLRSASLSVATGQSVAIMGPSGSGKSTLLSLIAFQLTPDAGQIEAVTEGVEWVLQSAPGLARRSAVDNVALGPLSRGSSRSRALGKARATMRRLNVEHLAHDRLSTLSGGERQRIAISRAVAADPQLLLVDEPTAALDHASRQVVMEVLRAVTSMGGTMIVATHDEGVAQTCDRCLDLIDGALVERLGQS